MLKVLLHSLLLISCLFVVTVPICNVDAQPRKKSKKKLYKKNLKNRKARCYQESLSSNKSNKSSVRKPIPSTFYYKSSRKLRISKVDNEYLADLYLPLNGVEKSDHIRFRLKCDLNLKCVKSHKVKVGGVWENKPKPSWDFNKQSRGIIYGGRTILSFSKEQPNSFKVKYINLLNAKGEASGMVVTCEI